MRITMQPHGLVPTPPHQLPPRGSCRAATEGEGRADHRLTATHSLTAPCLRKRNLIGPKPSGTRYWEGSNPPKSVPNRKIPRN